MVPGEIARGLRRFVRNVTNFLVAQDSLRPHDHDDDQEQREEHHPVLRELAQPFRQVMKRTAPRTEPVIEPSPPMTIMMMISKDLMNVNELVWMYIR